MIINYEINDDKYLTIKQILKEKFEMSDRLILKLKTNKRIFLNDISVYINHPIKIGDKLTLDMNFVEDNSNIVPTKMNLCIIYEDEFMLILNKPAGIAIHPSQLHFDNSLSNGVKFYFDSIGLKRKIRPVNRLDKDTSGIVIFAKNEYIQECLIKQMKNNTFKKEYIAILDGNLENKSGTINAPIARKEGSIIERCVDKNGDIAISHYTVLKTLKNTTVVLYTLETGRTHQLRVHSKFIGHPIIGDTLYGEASSLISRQALHSYKINLIHPITKEKMEFIAEIPEDIKKVRNINF